jgi:hypothetical protein
LAQVAAHPSDISTRFTVEFADGSEPFPDEPDDGVTLDADELVEAPTESPRQTLIRDLTDVINAASVTGDDYTVRVAVEALRRLYEAPEPSKVADLSEQRVRRGR